MRTYRGIAGFELVPPTKSIAPVRPPRDELFLFSHTSYNPGEILPPPSDVILLRCGIGQSSSSSRGFVKESGIPMRTDLGPLSLLGGWSALRLLKAFFVPCCLYGNDISLLRGSWCLPPPLQRLLRCNVPVRGN